MTESSSQPLCPLAKLGRLSPACASYDNRYHSSPLRESCRQSAASSESLEYNQSSSLDLNYNQNCVRYSAIPSYDRQKYRLSQVSGLPSKETAFTSSATYNSQLNFSGKTSPCFDQGYHTLVSASPSGWPATTCVNKSKKSVSCKYNYFERLSDELVLHIFSYLNTNELCSISSICRRWYNLAWDQSLWKTISLSGDTVCADKAIKCILRRLCSQANSSGAVGIQQIFIYDGAKITDKGLMLLSRRCLELTHVHLQNCPDVTDSSISQLATKCCNLQHLDLTGCSLVSCISVLPGVDPSRKLLLQYLDLTDCSSVQDASLRVILRNCPQLIYLYLRRCVRLTDAGVKFIPSFCSSLREISMSDCSEVTDFALHELAKLGTNLRYLSVAKCNRVSDAGLKVIAKRCYKLRYLNVRGCEAVSDDAIMILARSCSRLRALDIGKCDVSDTGLRALAESCPNLKKLSLRNCDLVTDRGIQYVSYYCRGLQQLNIQDCQISVEGYRAVKRYCKRCIIEHTNPGFF